MNQNLYGTVFGVALLFTIGVVPHYAAGTLSSIQNDEGGKSTWAYGEGWVYKEANQTVAGAAGTPPQGGGAPPQGGGAPPVGGGVAASTRRRSTTSRWRSTTTRRRSTTTRRRSTTRRWRSTTSRWRRHHQ